MSPSQPFDASIPVLTEVIDIETEATPPTLLPPDVPAPSAGAAAPLPAAAGTEAHPAPDPAALERQAVAAWGADEWAALEQRLAGRIVQQLQDRVDFVLEQRIRDSMAGVLQRALGALTDELREGLGQTIEQIVARAVSHELGHLKSGKP